MSSTLMLPERMGTNPLMARKRVVLPAPLGPRIATFSPRSRESETPFNTGGEFFERTTTRSWISRTGTVISPGNAGIQFRCSKHFQLFTNFSDQLVLIVAGPHKALPAQDCQYLIVPPL